MAEHWVLVGLMGSGKTTIGRLLAARAGRDFIDNDAQLMATTGRTAAELQAEHGRDALHRFEREALVTALDGHVPAVIAAAASVVDDPQTRAVVRRAATVIWLDVDPEELARRVRRPSHRPLSSDPLPQLEEQHRVRAAALQEVADLVVAADGTPEQIVDEVWRQLSLAT